ncbi:efflux RND transporter periplasmic adaptor subunit [Enhygromyxa salina]|uniref:Multidrug resistance protein MdtA n=1 Tax=Enhygromyxa salina TaxID=215803 RepID=A0A2S9YU21_9BACT|nr:HlyD family efflux transporter periplasmic adaptor subunit [Enhygromyxa salina]PRQ08588.1 Multidrug resistance protein MdtA precursor [Enhygromyxa salina]
MKHRGRGRGRGRARLLTAALALASACEVDGPVAGVPAASVAVGPPPQQTSVAVVPWTGIVRRPSLELVAPDHGEIAAVHIGLGSVVAVGELLVELEQPQLETELEQARSRLRQASAELEAARRDEGLHRRVLRADEQAKAVLPARELWAAEQRASDATSRRSIAAAQAHAVAVEIESLERRLAAGRLRAPFSARVAAVGASVGQHVDAGAPLVRLIEERPPEVRFAVPQAELDHLGGVGATVEVRPSANADAQWSARVERVAPEVDPVSQLVIVEATLLDGSAQLSSGQACVVAPGIPG